MISKVKRVKRSRPSSKLTEAWLVGISRVASATPVRGMGDDTARPGDASYWLLREISDAWR